MDANLNRDDEAVSKIAGKIKVRLGTMGNWDLENRIAWLRYFDAMVAEHKDKILSAVAKEKGISEHQVLLNEYLVVRLLCKFLIKNARNILGDEDRSQPFSLNFGNKKRVVRKEPLGVVGIISPSNYPFSLLLCAVLPALVAGNGVIWKPAPDTPDTNQLVLNLLYQSLAEFGAVMLIWQMPGGAEAGQSLVRCKNVDKIHFTGSDKAGWAIARLNAETRLMPATLELGGSNPAIVLEDANIKQAAKTIIWARFCGMSCNNIKRVLVVSSRYVELVEELSTQIKALSDHEAAPVSEREAVNYQRFVSDYEQVMFGEAPKEVRPNPRMLIVPDANADLLVLKEETFVPLLPVVQVRDEADAVRCANSSRFGLGASVFTRDKKRFERVAGQLDCTTVYHNDAMTEFAQMPVPFGGRKDSGTGYSHGPEGLLDFTQLKTIITERWPAPKPQLYPWTKGKMNFLRRMADWIAKLS
ncbi:MAG: aldehyde dehydrogenase [bacterium]|nr:aldehyde dehydrogenase [bacterium]